MKSKVWKRLVAAAVTVTMLSGRGVRRVRR